MAGRSPRRIWLSKVLAAGDPAALLEDDDVENLVHALERAGVSSSTPFYGGEERPEALQHPSTTCHGHEALRPT